MDIALLGCGCSAATEAVAEIVQYWSLPQVCIITVYPCRPVGRVGLRGIPLLALKNFRYRTLNALLFVSSPLASPPLRITAVQASLVAAIHPACSRMTSG